MSTLVLSFSLGAAAAGGALAYLVAETRNRRERVALAREMTRQVRARYEAYVAMEGRVARGIDEFDRAEAARNERRADQTRQMRRLHKALDGYEGRETQFAERAPVTVQVDALPSDLAAHHADAGYNLVINGRRPQSDVQDTLAALASRGAEVLYRPMDVSNLDEHQAMLDAINEKFGRLDSLVNNAGVAPNVRADILEDEASPESFDRLININLRGPYFLTQAAAKWMVAQKKADADFKGTIINVSSISATVVSVNRGDYCISKAGVAMATQLWAARLGEYGLGVFEVRPGVIRPDMPAGVTEKYDKLFENGLAVEPRWGEPADIGKAVTALASGDMTYATGNVFMVDGGLTIQRL